MNIKFIKNYLALANAILTYSSVEKALRKADNNIPYFFRKTEKNKF